MTQIKEAIKKTMKSELKKQIEKYEKQITLKEEEAEATKSEREKVEAQKAKEKAEREAEAARKAAMPKGPQQPIIVVKDLKAPMDRDKNGMPKNKKKPTSTDARFANDLNNKDGAAAMADQMSSGGMADPLASDGMPSGVIMGGSSSMMSSFGNSMKSSDDKKKGNTYSPGPYWPHDLPLPKETGKELKEAP